MLENQIPPVPMQPIAPTLPYELLDEVSVRVRMHRGHVGQLHFIRVTELGLHLRVVGKNLDDPVLNEPDRSNPRPHRAYLICKLDLSGPRIEEEDQVRLVLAEPPQPGRARTCAVVGPLLPFTVIVYTPSMTWRELAWRLNGHARSSIERIHEAARDAGVPFPNDPAATF